MTKHPSQRPRGVLLLAQGRWKTKPIEERSGIEIPVQTKTPLRDRALTAFSWEKAAARTGARIDLDGKRPKAGFGLEVEEFHGEKEGCVMWSREILKSNAKIA